MKKIFTNILIGILVLGLGFSFKHGVTKKGQDRTGSPLSIGKCFNCHKAGKFGVSLEMKIFEGENEVNNYTPGHRYKLKFQIKHTGNPSKFGFQITSLNKENKDGGKFENLPDGFALRKLSGVNYIDHTSPRPVQFLNVDWVAPATHEGDVTVYFGGIAANGNGGTSGDGGAVKSFKIADGTTGLDYLSLENDNDLFILDGIVHTNYLRLRKLKADNFSFKIFDRQGRIILKNNIYNYTSSNYDLMLNGLSSGLYFIQMISSKKSTVKSFVVK